MLCAGVLLQSGAGSFTHYVHSLEERQCCGQHQSEGTECGSCPARLENSTSTARAKWLCARHPGPRHLACKIGYFSNAISARHDPA